MQVRQFRVLLDPSEDEFASGGVVASQATQETTDPSPSPSAQEPLATAPTSPQVAGQADPADSQSGLLTVADAIKKLGVNLPDEAYNQGDYGALQALAQRAAQAQQLQEQLRRQDLMARLGQSIAPHVDQFQQYLKTTQKPAAPERQPWEPPANPSEIEHLMMFVDRDQNTGYYVAKQGADPSIARKVNEYQEWQRDFLRNPGALIQQAAEHVAQKMFDQRFEERFQQVERQRQVERIMAENSSWLYQRGADGAPVVQNGSYALTPAGTSYAKHVRSLDHVSDPVQKNAIAIAMVKAELYDAQLRQSQASSAAAQAAAPAQQQALAGGQPNRNPLQALSAAQIDQTPGAVHTNAKGLSMRELLKADFARQGITDADFAPDAFEGS